MELSPATPLPLTPLPARNRAAVVAAVVSLFLAGSKLTVGALTGSVSVLASGLDSLLDVLSSGMNAWAIHAAVAPPDDEHRFGHGKFESVAALVQAAFVGGSAVFVFTSATHRLDAGEPLVHPDLALWTMAASTLAAIALVTWQAREVRRTGSLAVTADRAHYTSDVFTGLGVIVAVVATSRWNLYWVDPLVSLGVAVVLLHTGFSLARKAMKHLLDHALPADDLRKIEAVIARFSPPVLGHHGLRTRSDGVSRFVDVHLEVNGALTLHQANRVYTDIVTALREALPGVDLSIHLDPAGAPDPIERT